MSAAAESDRAGSLHTQRSRQVWVALILSTVAFLVLCGAVAIGISSYASSITDTKGATVKALPPSVLAVLRHTTTIPEQITGTTGLQEGDVATTGGGDQAFITLFGDSGSIQMYFNTSVEMEKLRTNRFIQDSTEIAVVLHRGTIVFATGEPGGDQASYTLASGQAEVEFQRGAHLRVSVRDEQGPAVTQVVVDAGKATMWAHGKRVELGPGQMAWISGNEEPQGPATAQVDLIHNGSFEEPPTQSSEEVSEGGLGTAAWLPLRADDQGSSGPDSPAGSVGITDEVALRAAVISGEGTPSRYVKVGITQDINEPASFFNQIELSATVKLVTQALPAGGPVPDVYPMIIRIVYTDQQGKNHEWKRSFYFEGPDPQPSDSSVIKITQGRWTTTQEIAMSRHALQEAGAPEHAGSAGTSSALFMLKSHDTVQDIAVINAIEIYGYGTQFQSWITGISLLAR